MAIATLISNVLSAILVMVYLCRRKDEFKFCFRNMRIENKYLKNILKIGIPAGVQGAIFQYPMYLSRAESILSERMQ